MTTPDMVVHTEPRKEFFVEMLTRDITVVDCVMDLIDNAVDKEVDRTGLDVMQLLMAGDITLPPVTGSISITIEPDAITIADTCGGISVDDAKNRAFLLGNPGTRSARAGLSIYGIGMKRAFFKLGRIIEILSRTDKEEFTLTIDVDKWVEQPGWNLELKSVREISEHESTGMAGTRIHISHLRDPVREMLEMPDFRNELRNRLSAGYALFLKAGLKLDVNDEPVSSELPVLVGGNVQPVRQLIKYLDVEILIVAGLSPKSDRKPRGWYVFCNGRMVAEADKTSLTGWGTLLPEFRSKFNHFLGFVYFRSDNVWNLPWTTTKQGLFREAPVYQTALREMRTHAGPVLSFLDSLYRDDVAPEDLALERAVLAGDERLGFDEVLKTETQFHISRPTRTRSTKVNIQYKRPRDLIDRIRQHLKRPRMPATEVGQHTFDYFVKQELE